MIDWSSSKPEERSPPGGLTPYAQEKVSGESPQCKVGEVKRSSLLGGTLSGHVCSKVRVH